MTSRRHLLHVAYIGKGFLGVPRSHHGPTVIGEIERGMRLLKTHNSVYVVTSSRTDKGVSAFNNTLQVDLTPREENRHYDPDFVTDILNYYLMKRGNQTSYGLNLRVKKTQIVSDDFHCRGRATGRTYVYRVADSLTPHTSRFWAPLEVDRTHCIPEKLDMELVQQACEMLSGTHNFRMFTSPRQLHPFRNPVKTMKVEVHPSQAFMHHHIEGIDNHFRFWEFTFHANSFLYRQVRRMMSGILAVGSKQINITDLGQALNEEKPLNTKQQIAPAAGLYLKQVHYNAEDLVQPDLGDSVPIKNLSDIFGEEAKYLQLFDLLRPTEVPESESDNELDDEEDSESLGG